jgi:SAM-dependent methyltransferase
MAQDLEPAPRDWRTAMRHDWDARARKNAPGHIHLSDAPLTEESFFASGRADYERFLLPFLRDMEFDPESKTALEIGCGIGRFTRRMVEDFREVIGVDVSPEMIARAQAYGWPGARFQVISGAGLEGISSGSVDFVFSYGVLQHVPDRGAIVSYFRETARVLRPGGVFRLHLKGLATARVGRMLVEAGFSLNPKLLRLGLSLVPFARLRWLDTWQGHSIPLPQARRLCATLGLEIADVESPWTTAMWIGGWKE